MSTATEIELKVQEAFLRLVPIQVQMRRAVRQAYHRLQRMILDHLADEEMQLQRWADDGGPAR